MTHYGNIARFCNVVVYVNHISSHVASTLLTAVKQVVGCTALVTFVAARRALATQDLLPNRAAVANGVPIPGY